MSLTEVEWLAVWYTIGEVLAATALGVALTKTHWFMSVLFFIFLVYTIHGQFTLLFKLTRERDVNAHV